MFKFTDKFWIGLLLGIVLPILFGLLFFHMAYKGEEPFWHALWLAMQSKLSFFGKFILVSLVPDLGLIFLFYKAEYWRAGRGIIVSTILFFILAFAYMT
jgi:hypothetical protein